MKTKTPAQYRAPLMARAALVQWLTDRAASNPRKSYGLFTYDVKLRGLKTDFTHLCNLAREAGELAADASPRYLAEVEAVYDAHSDAVWEQATEFAAENVTENDTNRMLWDGSEAIAEWGFAGRSGGWLVLTEFDGVKFETALRYGREAADYFATPEADGGPSYGWLRRLYRFLVQCDADFKRPETEVEHQAAFNLFVNFAAEVETDEQAAERIAAEAREQAERAHWEARDTVTLTA